MNASIDLTSTFHSLAVLVTDFFPILVEWTKHIVGFFIGLSIIFTAFLLFGIIYCVEGLKHIRKKEHDMYDLKVEEAFESDVKADPASAKRWDSVVRHIESNNQNDWRQSILECDIILEELLNKMEYHGDSIGEKLKKVEKADFKTLDEAWEAHKFRNQIAHEGSTMSVNQYEAKRVVNLYKKVFEEFYYI